MREKKQKQNGNDGTTIKYQYINIYNGEKIESFYY